MASVAPAPSLVTFKPGMFQDVVKIEGDILLEGNDLGVEWEVKQCLFFIYTSRFGST